MSLRVKSDTYTGQTEWVAIPVIHVINVQTSNDSPFFFQNFFEGRDVFHEHVKEYKLH